MPAGAVPSLLSAAAAAVTHVLVAAVAPTPGPPSMDLMVPETIAACRSRIISVPSDAISLTGSMAADLALAASARFRRRKRYTNCSSSEKREVESLVWGFSFFLS